jgi:N-acetylated-alpha-linked acidic dipeptidase
MIVEASHNLKVPTGEPLYDVWRKTRAQEEKTKAPLADNRLVNTRIGSGSDHTVFLNHLGRPTVGLEFDGQYGVYHSMYDDHFWMEHFGDLGFKYHIVISDLWGLLALRLANANVLPFDFAAYAANIHEFVRDLDQHSKVQKNVDLRPLLSKIGELEKAGQELNATASRGRSANTLNRAAAEKLSQQLMQAESNWLAPQGIPGRPWFQHLLYAARYTYAHLELPGLTEAAEKGDWAVAKTQVALLKAAVEKNTQLLREAKAGLENPGMPQKPQR